MRLIALAVPFALAALTAPAAQPRADAPAAARVLILSNGSDPDSLAVARHYASARGVPDENLFAFPMPSEETISWDRFVAAVWQPLRDALVQRHWIDAIGMSALDSAGRRKYAVSGHRIAALVLCRGVPLRIEHEPRLYAAASPYTDRPQFRTNEASVDSELSLLAHDGVAEINGFILNPLFHNEAPSGLDRGKVVEVCRLDGPTAADAMGLVDRAISAERDGLLGRGYVDLGGPSAEGDRWLEDVAAQISVLGFDPTVDRDPRTFPASARLDAPALYFGWHDADLDGPFALPGVRFPAGAIALHIYSFSAHTVRSDTEGWVGPLVARGVTATFGNVYEPYLRLTHRPDLLLRALSRGATLADAAYYSLPALSWQAITVGDPLYRPFAVSLEDQLARLSSLPPEWAVYAVLRHARLLEASGQSTRALAILDMARKERRSLVLALAVAERLKAAGRPSEAAAILGSSVETDPIRPDEWGLAAEATGVLGSVGGARSAVAGYRRLLALPGLTLELRARWLADARQQAIAAADASQAAAWKRDLEDAVAGLLRGKPRP